MEFNPVVYALVFLVLLGYLIHSTINPTVDDSYTVIGIIIGILVVVYGFQYIYGVSIMTYVTDLTTNEPKVQVVVDDIPYNGVPYNGVKKQVFNVQGNDYNYENAKAVCGAYGARLATYKEVEDAYNDGGEWCNYGWSDGQMALFPTQQKTFDTLQETKGHENDCGRPGVNGGYMANSQLQFGANCYGVKPKITTEEEEMMQHMTPYPLSAEDAIFQKRVDYWKNKVDELDLSPFNNANWSE